MSRDFFLKRSRCSPVELFYHLTTRQLNDSPVAYLWIGIASTLYVLWASVSIYFEHNSYFTFNSELLKNTESLTTFFPPFLLTIVAIFPAFSENAKRKLREINRKGEPRVASFLDQFVFLVMLSLLLLILSKVFLSLKIFETPRTGENINSLIILPGSMIFACFLSLFWEIIEAIKSLYILILREYFEDL